MMICHYLTEKRFRGRHDSSQAADVSPHLSSSKSGFSGITLAHNTWEQKEVDVFLPAHPLNGLSSRARNPRLRFPAAP